MLDADGEGTWPVLDTEMSVKRILSGKRLLAISADVRLDSEMQFGMTITIMLSRKGLVTAWKGTRVWALGGVGAHVRFEVVGAGKGLFATWKLALEGAVLLKLAGFRWGQIHVDHAGRVGWNGLATRAEVRRA